MIIYGYARCSTDESRQNIDRQVRELKELGATKEPIYLEYESGTNSDIVELNRLLEKVKENDAIVATEVSRITRSTKQLCDILELVQDRKLKLILGGFVVDCTKGEIDPMTEGMLKMMGVFAEMERNMISQRVKSGMLNAKVKGKQIGRKRTVKEDIPPIFLKHYDKYKINQEND
ncbi:recombinase family protein [Paraclostridium sordellii]|uniref:recombinase family protein n=1 Tax=Paraclostridium sordellii TaxID=1505 RepID=UPI000E4805E9|nr:recombinase family protein [Paeniclostridium sordellii]RGX13694.1 recombinase family protein [Paeniclostridium sordellii]